MNNHFYIPQKPNLKSVIHSIWQVDRINSFYKENIIPTGIVEIIFDLSNDTSIPVQLHNRQYHLSKCFITGFNTTPIQLDLPKQQFFFGIRFQPLAIKKLLKTPASEFSNNPVDLALIDPSFQSLWYQLAGQKSFDNRVAVFFSWLEKKIPEYHAQETLINHFLADVDQHDLSVTQLAGSLCYSPRHLSRKILEATGMNTEEILLYKKYLHAMHLMHHTELSLTKIAYQSHFSDQSHFTKTFKNFTGITPGSYKRNKSFLMGHLYEHVR